MNDLHINRVQQLFAQAKDRVVIVSAFVGMHALSSLLQVVPSSISTKIYVRWRLQDIYSRATDPEIFDIAQQHGAMLMCHNNLHAKAYIADDIALIGSANATRLGLGMLPRNNLELLAAYDARSPEVEKLLSILEDEAKHATQMPLDHMENIEDNEFASHIGEKPDKNWIPKSDYKSAVSLLQSGKWSKSAADDCVALGCSIGASEKEIQIVAINTEIFKKIKEHLLEIASGMTVDDLARWLLDYTGDNKYNNKDLCLPLVDWLHHCPLIYVLDFGTSNPKLTYWSPTR